MYFNRLTSRPLYSPLSNPGTNLNAAESGAVSRRLMDQFDFLHKRLKHRGLTSVNKLITLFIGSNDACFSCKGIAGVNSWFFQSSPEQFEGNLVDVWLSLSPTSL